MTRAFAITLALLALVFAFARLRYAPPAAHDAPPDRFSGVRAREMQRLVVGDGATRFVGTPGNARARDAIASELAKLGWAVETTSARSCTHHGTCAPVTNILARLPGEEPAVLLSAHHDSVLAGPGASDDGFGAAALLEVARALKAGAPPKRAVLLLFTDGEEAGLLGAGAFVRDQPPRIAVTINVDSRGSTGPSQMFETSADNAWLIAAAAKHLERPVTTSLFYEIYKRMPNDTDFTMTKRIAPGINFANTAGIEHYHTPLDDLDTANPGTLQHHGDNVLAMTRAFTDGPLDEKKGSAVWFDVLALGIVRWPSGWSLPLALVALIGVAAHSLRSAKGSRIGLATLAVAIPGMLAAALAGFLLRSGGAIPAMWIAHPTAAILGVQAAALAAVVALGALLRARSTPRMLWSGVWIGWASLGVVAAAFAPGTSFLFIVPSLVAALAGALPIAIASAAPAVVASVVLFAIDVALYEALGFAVPPVLALPLVLVAITLLPLLPSTSRRVPLFFAAVALASMLVAFAVPKFSESVRQRVNVVFRQEDTKTKVIADTNWGRARWGEPPVVMPAGHVPRVDLPPPTFELLGREGRRIKARIRSARAAPIVTLAFKSSPGPLLLDGAPASLRDGITLRLLGLPAEGAVIELDDPTAFTLSDTSPGVPPGTRAEEAVRARPFNAVAFQDGDVTVVQTLVNR